MVRRSRRKPAPSFLEAGEPVVVGAVGDILEQERRQVALAGVRQHRQDRRARFGRPGDLQRRGSVTGLSVPALQHVGPVQAALRLKNDGNVHFRAEGTAQLASPFGDIGRPLPFKGEVLPGTTRKFDIKLPATTPIGLYRVTATVKYLDRTEIISHWTLLMPQVTFYILSGTLLLLVSLLAFKLVSRAKRRHRS